MSKTPQQKSQLTGTPARKSALLAIAVAGAMLNSPQPAISAKKIESKETVIQQIVGDRDLSPETRAYFLLRLAEGYLAGIDGSNYVPNRNDPNRSTSFLKPGVWETMLEPWALEVSSDTWLNNREIGNWHEKSGHADEAVQTAMIQMEKSSDKYSKLNMQYIASRLFLKIKDEDGVRRCNKMLEDEFRSCEQSATIDEKRITSVAYILILMAAIPNVEPVVDDWAYRERRRKRDLQPKQYAQNEIEAKEEDLLRIVRLVDKLPAGNHVRRKTHRDLALWYMQIGKSDLAEKQKQILFELVGIHDDSILYPQSAGCGRLLWWKAPSKISMGCGMG